MYTHGRGKMFVLISHVVPLSVHTHTEHKKDSQHRGAGTTPTRNFQTARVRAPLAQLPGFHWKNPRCFLQQAGRRAGTV